MINQNFCPFPAGDTTALASYLASVGTATTTTQQATTTTQQATTTTQQATTTTQQATTTTQQATTTTVTPTTTTTQRTTTTTIPDGAKGSHEDKRTGGAFMDPFAASQGWWFGSSFKDHRKFAERNGVSKCSGCHSVLLGQPS